MKRTTVSLPDELVSALMFESRRRHAPVSQVVREALEEKFLKEPSPLPFVGLFGDAKMTPGAEVERVLRRSGLMPSAVIVDTGALVAALSRADPDHARCAAALQRPGWRYCSRQW